MPPEAVTALAALIASFLSRLLGIGGGLVLTPLLLYLTQAAAGAALSVKVITGLTIVQAISGSVLGLWRHSSYGNVSRGLVLLMGPPSAGAALVGALVSGATSDQVLRFIFAAMPFVGAVMLVLPVEPQERAVGDLEVDRPLAVAISLALGFFGGMVGIGGIASIIAVLVYVLRVPPRVAIGTSLGIGIFAAVVFVSALVASPVGAAVSVRRLPRVLLVVLSVVVALAAIRIAITALSGT